MISTPDAVLQAVIKRALIESGSPSHVVSELMENAHERRWPQGLSTLETRQLNRRQYENYLTKRIPGKFAAIHGFKFIFQAKLINLYLRIALLFPFYFIWKVIIEEPSKI